MLNPQSTVAGLVLEHSECARVFSRFRIDFCCRGQMTIAEACKNRGASLEEVMGELEVAMNRDRATGLDARKLSDAALIAHLITQYHEPLRVDLPFIRGLADKVARVHPQKDGVQAVAEMVAAMTDALLPHLDEEEQKVFPAMMSRDRARLAGMGEEIRVEHVAIGRLLEDIRAAAFDFVPPEGACNSHRTLLKELEQLEAAIHRHVHLENNVLLPRHEDEARKDCG